LCNQLDPILKLGFLCSGGNDSSAKGSQAMFEKEPGMEFGSTSFYRPTRKELGAQEARVRTAPLKPGLIF